MGDGNSDVETVSSSTNINISELDEETTRKLKGDAIGDTLYSQSFVLKTLLQFSSFEWNSQFEEDLCFLWDMTVENDVCNYLFSVSYPAIACTALEKYDEPRFVEIVIGILANILCADCPSKDISVEEINAVLRELDSDDPLTLIQIMRFIGAIAYGSSDLNSIDQEIMNKIKFIMNNSVNHDLLEKTIETVAKITLNYRLNRSFVNLELYNATLTAFCTIFSCQEFSLDCKNKIDTCKYTLETISNICAYVDNFEDYEVLIELQRNYNKYINEVLKILKYYSLKENLLPVTDEIIFFMSVFRYTFLTLNINYISNIVKYLCNILFIIRDVKDEINDMFETVIETLCFLVSQDNQNEFKNTLKSLSKNRTKVILQLLCDNKHKYDFEFDIQDLVHKYIR